MEGTKDHPLCKELPVSSQGQVTIPKKDRMRLGIIDGESEINITDIVVVK